MGVADEDLAVIRAWCQKRMPDPAQHRVEARARGSAVTIVECRAPWTGRAADPWTSLAIAQLRLDAQGRWTLHWQDSRDRWHRLEDLPPIDRVEPLLAVVGRDPEGLFWG